MKHTPAPWKILYDVMEVVEARNEDRTIAHVGTRDNFKEEYLANARLIVKAPELLAAVEDMVAWQCKHCTCKEEPWSETEECPNFCQELKYKRLIEEVNNETLTPKGT